MTGLSWLMELASFTAVRTARKLRETPSKDGKREGVETWWYQSGAKQGERHYNDDKENGLEVAWLESGVREFENHWKDGRKMDMRDPSDKGTDPGSVTVVSMLSPACESIPDDAAKAEKASAVISAGAHSHWSRRLGKTKRVTGYLWIPSPRYTGIRIFDKSE